MKRTREMERKSSAVTLSDMEIFIFPELMYGLVLANIMSPRIWKWREDPWFVGFERMTPYRRIVRLKQFIMDHYSFNLDLDTWGLTSKSREMARFKSFIDEDTLARSNALFGYEGDKYYFDIDIRTHFGLDKYEGEIIPYWKTETVEAMDSFSFKSGYKVGAGECVSLAALYASALFVVARIPLKDIYLTATPLHSQNFIDIDEGILTNNRRLVTKTMWFNGSALSGQARRALENERVTIVTHESGYVHGVYDHATIDEDAYSHFKDRLSSYLKVEFTPDILGNFLRDNGSFQKCFQLRWKIHGEDHYVPIERVFAYEHGSPYRLTDNTRPKLVNDIDQEEFKPEQFCDRIVLNDLEEFIREHSIDLDVAEDAAMLKEQFSCGCLERETALDEIMKFCHVKPRFPEVDEKQFETGNCPLSIDPEMGREEVIERLEAIRGNNEFADLAFYAYRDVTRCEPEPFVLACIERNPVCVVATTDLDIEAVIAALAEMPDESIYDGPARLAQPDEVWNYGRGDGLEKALVLADILRNRDADADLSVAIAGDKASVNTGSTTYDFTTSKGLPAQTWQIP